MSNLDDKAKHAEVEGENGEETHQKGRLLVFIFFLVGVVLALVVGWVVYPAVLYSEQEQPIQFNHELHMYEVYNDAKAVIISATTAPSPGFPSLVTAFNVMNTRSATARPS